MSVTSLVRSKSPVSPVFDVLRLRHLPPPGLTPNSSKLRVNLQPNLHNLSSHINLELRPRLYYFLTRSPISRSHEPMLARNMVKLGANPYKLRGQDCAQSFVLKCQVQVREGRRLVEAGIGLQWKGRR